MHHDLRNPIWAICKFSIQLPHSTLAGVFMLCFLPSQINLLIGDFCEDILSLECFKSSSSCANIQLLLPFGNPYENWAHPRCDGSLLTSLATIKDFFVSHPCNTLTANRQFFAVAPFAWVCLPVESLPMWACTWTPVLCRSCWQVLCQRTTKEGGQCHAFPYRSFSFGT